MSKYPEHEKLKKREKDALLIGSFYDFLQEQEWEIAEYDDESERLFTVRQRPEEIIGLFLGVDPKKLEAEKRAMLEEIRRTDEQRAKEL